MKIALRILVSCCLVAVAHAEDAARMVNQFGLSCVKHTTGNALLSPWSLEQSLGMAYVGARGKTRAEMAAVLGFPEDLAAGHAAFTRMSAMMVEAQKAGAQTFQNANGLFVDGKVPLLEEWKGIAIRDFQAEIDTPDFANAEAVRAKVNAWAKERTNGKIAEAVPALPPNGVLVLINALAFDKPWDERFTKELTRNAPFYTERGRGKVVPLMFKQHALRYAHKDGFQIAALPYAGGLLQFVVILPDAMDGLAQVEARLTAELLRECATLPLTEVRLSFPRFKMEPPVIGMKPLLSNLGMGSAFNSSADFSGISPADLQISEVFHGAFLETDEDGTKAAATSGTVMRLKNGHPREVPHETVTADHPFLFLVQDVQSGACLFIGRLKDPLPGAPAGAMVPQQSGSRK